MGLSSDKQDIIRQIGEYDGDGIYVFRNWPDLIEFTKNTLASLGLSYTIDDKSHPTKTIFHIEDLEG